MHAWVDLFFYTRYSFFLENRKVKLSITVHSQVHTIFQLNESSQKGNEKRTQIRGNNHEEIKSIISYPFIVNKNVK